MRQDESDHRKKQRHDCRGSQEQQPHEACGGDIVQYAEEDETVRKGKIGRDGNEQRRTGHHRKTFAERRPVHALAMGEKQAETGQEQERAGDAARIEFPQACRRRAGFEIAEIFQVPCEVIGCHGDEGQPAQGVETADAAFAAVFVCGCVCVHVSRFFQLFEGADIHLDSLEMTRGLGP
ncbi:hypothetical protein D3C72_1224410 [compost metagenome]